jgi:hypothetical protein
MRWWRVSSWVRIRFEHLRRWREYAESVCKTAKNVLGEDVEAYVVGGVAEERTTVLSDIDILIVANTLPRNTKGLYDEILGRAIDVYGLPWDAPVELYIWIRGGRRNTWKQAGAWR